MLRLFILWQFLGALKEDLGKFFQTKEALKMVLSVCSN